MTAIFNDLFSRTTWPEKEKPKTDKSKMQVIFFSGIALQKINAGSAYKIKRLSIGKLEFGSKGEKNGYRRINGFRGGVRFSELIKHIDKACSIAPRIPNTLK